MRVGSQATSPSALLWVPGPRERMALCSVLFFVFFFQCQRLVLLFWLVPGSHEPVQDGEVTETLYLTNRAARGFT